MIHDDEQAGEALAGAVWWFKGFAAARPASVDEGSGEHRQLESKLRDVRQFIGRLRDGFIRRLGDEQAIVLTYAELEKLSDGFRAIGDSSGFLEVDAHNQVKSARETLAVIFAEYAAETRAARDRRNPDLPF